jgi:protein-disulfide isomerase
VTRLEWDKHRARLRWVEQEVLRREAEAQGLPVDELLRRNVDYRAAVSDEEVEAAYREQGGTGGAVPREKKLAVAAQLVMAKRPAIEAEFLKELFAKYAVDVRVPLPGTRETLEFNPRGGPERGPKDAPLSIVVFSDFSCPACARVHEWLAQAPKELGVPIRVAYRHFPLGLPGPAAHAAVAAHEQGRFWELADVLFRQRGTLDLARMDGYASEAGLNLGALDQCLASGRPQAAVAADADEARRLGIKTAPTLFINGVHFAGVPNPRVLKAILARDTAK